MDSTAPDTHRTMPVRDLIAGVSVAGLLLPEAVAYASIAGLPPERAILAGIVGGLVYAAIGRSRFAIVSATSSSAAILAAILAGMPGGPSEKGMVATLVVAIVGLLLLGASLLRMSALTDFISRPVLRGFAFGLAITITALQLPGLLGLAMPAEAGRFGPIVDAVSALPGLHPMSAAIGLASLTGLLLLRRLPAIPGAFLVLAAGVAASLIFDLAGQGVATVGRFAFAIDWPSVPHVDWGTFSRLCQLALPLVLILFAESWGTIRTLALRHGDAIDGGRELKALGLANIASALVRGMPVGAGFSAGSANEAAGALSRISGVVAAIGLAVLVLAAAPLIAHLPKPVLAAVVVAAVSHALDPRPILRLWSLRRDALIAIAAAAGVLFFGIVNGMIAAIALSMAAVIQRFATPHVARLGRLGAHDYVDLARHADAVPPGAMVIWRPSTPMFFANAGRILGLIARGSEDSGVRGIVISFEESIDFDSSAIDALIEFDAAMRARGLRVHYARVHDRVRDLMESAGGEALDRRSHFSVDDAVVALAAELGKERRSDGA